MLRTSCLSLGLAALCSAPPAAGQETPRLVVVLTVDQMREDYVGRFGYRLEHGLRRLFAEGIRFDSAEHAHAFTNTAPGHATIATGTHPSSHGVVNNDWWDRPSRRRVYAVEDTTSLILGAPDLAGRSPRNLLRPALGDWLKTASPESRVYSVAIKDRVAVLMGGHEPDGAFWYNSDNGRYVTAEYYEKEIPGWLRAFNETGLVDSLMRVGWRPLRPLDEYVASREAYFAPETGGVEPAFPHEFPMIELPPSGEDGVRTIPDSAGYQKFRNTPLGDIPTFALARHLIEREDLGGDDAPDLLFVGASAADYVGHEYGPYSVEVEDHYLRLDILLGEFLAYLDARLGGAYRVVLTADHGVAPMAEESARRGEDAVRLGNSAIEPQLLQGLTEAVWEMEIVGQPRLAYIWPSGLVINFPPDAVTDEQMVTVRAKVAEAMRGAEAVVQAITYDDLLAGNVGGEFADAFARNFHPQRAADVVLLFKPLSHYPTSLPANHGSPYGYDRHVPLVFWGNGLAAARVSRAVTTVDIAPTVAVMLGIELPEGLDGRPLPEVTSVLGR